jgi:hypothetical protein
MREGAPSGLRLQAEDVQDLSVLSAHLQDAILRVGDIAFLKKKRRLALTLNRFCWERPPETMEGRQVYRRVNSGLHLEEVSAVAAKGIERASPEGLLYLLAIHFEAAGEGGTIELQFAGGATLRAKVEAIDVTLRDLGSGWLTESKPQHEIAAGGE